MSKKIYNADTIKAVQTELHLDGDFRVGADLTLLQKPQYGVDIPLKHLGLTMQHKFAGAVRTTSAIYGIPYASGSVLKIALSDRSMSKIITSGGYSLGGVLASNGKIYCAPFNRSSLLVIDTATDTVADDAFGLTLSGAWAGGALASDGKIYFCPNSATSLLIVNPVAGTAELATDFDDENNPGFPIDLSGADKWRESVLASNGKIYCISAVATDSLVINPTARTAKRTTFGLASLGFYDGGCLGADGKIYCANNTGVLVINPATDTAEIKYASVVAGETGFAWKCGPEAVIGDKIYFAPQDGTKWLVVDTALDTAVLDDFGYFHAAHGSYVGITTANNKIYAVPYHRNFVGYIDTQTPLGSTHQLANKALGYETGMLKLFVPDAKSGSGLSGGSILLSPGLGDTSRAGGEVIIPKDRALALNKIFLSQEPSIMNGGDADALRSSIHVDSLGYLHIKSQYYVVLGRYVLLDDALKSGFDSDTDGKRLRVFADGDYTFSFKKDINTVLSRDFSFSNAAARVFFETDGTALFGKDAGGTLKRPLEIYAKSLVEIGSGATESGILNLGMRKSSLIADQTGLLTLKAANAAATTNGVALNIVGSDGGTGDTDGGDILLTPGAKAGTGADGNVNISRGNLEVAGTKVIGPQGANVFNVLKADAPAAKATYTQADIQTMVDVINDLKGQVNALLAELRTHGLLGPNDGVI